MPDAIAAVTVTPDETIESLYARCPGKTLLVEPFSVRTTIGEFLKEGGIGFHSLAEASLAATIRRVKTDRFEHGSREMSFYNVGYPLHRMLEGPRGEAPAVDPGAIQSMDILVRPAASPNLAFRASGPEGLDAPLHRGDAFYVNEAAAPLFDLDRSGIVHATPCPETAPVGAVPVAAPVPAAAPAWGWAWDRRFFLDRVGRDRSVLKVLTQKSGFLRLAEAAPPPLALFALVVHLGILVVAAGGENDLKPVRAAVSSLPRTWVL